MKKLFILLILLLALAGCNQEEKEKSAELHTKKEVSLEEKTFPMDTVVNNKDIWTGEWHQQAISKAGNLEILNTTNETFDFKIQVFSGAHVGGMSGTAKIKNNTAVFTEKLTHFEGNCVLTFELKGETLNTTDDNCIEYGGIGVDFNGEYFKGEYVEKEWSLVELGIFDSDEEDERFRDLVGENYESFANRFQMHHMIFEDEKDLDGFDAVAKAGGVRGLFTIMEAVVVFDEKGNIWAAYIDDDLNVQYYTNVEEYKNKLPKTIEFWRERFKEYPVKYH